MLTDFVEIERILSGYGTVESGLQVRGPVVVEYVLAARVLLAHPGHAGEYALAAVDVLDGGFAEKEEHVLADFVRSHKVRFWKHEQQRPRSRYKNGIRIIRTLLVSEKFVGDESRIHNFNYRTRCIL